MKKQKRGERSRSGIIIYPRGRGGQLMSFMIWRRFLWSVYRVLSMLLTIKMVEY